MVSSYPVVPRHGNERAAYFDEGVSDDGRASWMKREVSEDGRTVQEDRYEIHNGNNSYSTTRSTYYSFSTSSDGYGSSFTRGHSYTYQQGSSSGPFESNFHQNILHGFEQTDAQRLLENAPYVLSALAVSPLVGTFSTFFFLRRFVSPKFFVPSVPGSVTPGRYHTYRWLYWPKLMSLVIGGYEFPQLLWLGIRFLFLDKNKAFQDLNRIIAPQQDQKSEANFEQHIWMDEEE